MATANELWLDALLRRQIALGQYERSLAEQIVALLDKTERHVRVELLDRLANMEGRSFTNAQLARLQVLENSLAKIRGGAFDQSYQTWDESLQKLAVSEAQYLNKNLKEISPVVLDTVIPDAKLLAALVDVQPMSGRLLKQWAETMRASDLQRIMDSVRLGLAGGETSDAIVRRVLGTRMLDGTDGVLEIGRRDAMAITNTAISTIANAARDMFTQENSDVFKSEVWVATLDDATCEECGALDGEEFPVGEGEQPPAHINCRCVRVPTIDGNLIGSRPSNAATEEALEGLNKEERREKIKELVGQVPASTKYSDWLGNQSKDFQDSVLGPSRGALFREGGLSLDRFVNSHGDRYSLEQLQRLEPGAFKKVSF